MAFIRSPNQQDLSWFVDMMGQGRLELSPVYQRKSVWAYKDKQFFLDTVLNNFPCPAIYLQKDSTDKGPVYNVVDGKQRLSTILDFHDGKIRLARNFAIPDFRGKKFADLPDTVKTEFYNYTFTVEQMRFDGEGGDVEWSEVFERVNRNQKKLTDQELRHARFDGWLINRAEDEVIHPLWGRLGVSSKSRSARMKDVEFVSILMLVVLEKEFVGFPQDSIDQLYAKYDFILNDLAEDEVDLNVQKGEECNEGEECELSLFTKENIRAFEEEFEKIRSFIEKMDEYNSCIVRHKKRLFTDVYTLWCSLAFEPSLIDGGHEKMATRYEKFISGVDDAFLKVKDHEDISSLPKEMQNYYSNSIGAATEEEPRRQRCLALTDYVKGS